MKRRFVSILMALVMALSLLPAQALAEDNTVTELNKNNISNYVTNGLGNGTYKLTEDVTITSTLNITGDTTVDLNGHVLRYDEAANPGSIFRVEAGKLTLTDSRPAATHEDAKLPAGGLITGGRGYRHDNGAGQSYNYSGGGVYVEADASFELAGGTIYACGVQRGANQAFGGGIYAEGGSVTMTGGAIRNCVLSANNSASGGGVYIYSGASFTMTGGVIAGCSANTGGGISAAGCTVQITGGRIENCKASGRGGGLSVSDHTNGPVSVLDAVISGCEAENGGGVALIGFAELELGENARITGCTATNGAAVYMDLGSTYTVNHPGCFLYANGGRVEGTVYVGTNKIGTKNNYEDSVKATNAIDHTDKKPTTVFTGDVSCKGDIRGGSFYGSVTAPDSADSMGTVWKKICGNISGGTFYGPVTTECHVSGGTFYRGLTMNKNAKLSGQPIDTGDVINDTTNTPEPNVTPATVTYAYGALGGTYATQIVQAGEKAIQPDVPSRQGYQFTDWYLDDTKYDFNAAVTGNMTLTAQWRINQYTITFDTDGGSAIDPITQDYGTAITAPADPTKTGYTFAGWNGAIPATMPAENMTIKANWTVNQYTISFDTDGGSDIAPITQDYGTDITAPAAPTKTGYTFAGWDRAIPATMPAGDMTITAHWAACAHANSGNKPTCTADATCTVCGGTIEKLGHDWGDWTPSSNKTHTRTCKTDSTHTETKNCADDNKDHVCDTCGATLTQHSGGTASCTAPATCGYCGKPYGEKNPANHSDLKHVPAKAATTQAEGNSEYWLCSGCGKCYKDAAAATEIALSDTVIAKRIPRRYSGPTITVMGAAYYDGGNVGLTFVSSADFDTFTGVQVDGKTLAAKNYIAERGSIEVYLKAVYLRTLKNGSHTVTIQSTAGDVSAVFTVENSKTSPGTSDPGVAVYALSSMLSLAGLAALRRRKED